MAGDIPDVVLPCRGVLPARETFQRARTAALRALEIDSALGEGYASLAHVRLRDWDWAGLDDDFQRALEINPGDAIAYYWYSEYLMAMGRSDESVAMVKTAHQMDPLSSLLSASLGMILYLARRYDESVQYLRKSLEMDADHFLLHFRLGLVYVQKEMGRQAIEEMKRAVSLSGRGTETLTGLAQAYAAAGMGRSRFSRTERTTQSRSWCEHVDPTVASAADFQTRSAIPMEQAAREEAAAARFELMPVLAEPTHHLLKATRTQELGRTLNRWIDRYVKVGWAAPAKISLE